MSILEYYKYAQLATAAYVRLGNLSWDGETFAREARSNVQQRLPESLAGYLFDPTSNTYGNHDVWNILYYYGGDNTSNPIAAADKSGFAATLFRQGSNGEKVLAIRGTEPSEDGAVDLVGADLGQIGVFGIALTQVVSMVNLIQRLKAAEGTHITQITVRAELDRPNVGSYVTANGMTGQPIYLVFGTKDGLGEGEIHAGDQITLTGHSLGGELAVIAALLFPEVFGPRKDVFVYNSAGINPGTADFLDLTKFLLPSGNASIHEALASELGRR